MTRILKYRLVPRKPIVTHQGAKLLKIMMQDKQATVWLEVDDTKPIVHRHIHHVVTGGTPPNGCKHVETLCIDGYHIIHFYDGGEL